MATKRTLLIVLGTRPEAIKLAPLILAARRTPGFEVVVVNTGQHAQMCAQVLGLFGIQAEVDLAVMKPRQTLTDITSAVLPALGAVLEAQQPDWLIVQGDTTTTFAAALAGFYHRVQVAHVEAGLRTGDPYSPYPEEMNRRLVTSLATLHFPPLASNADNLEREGVAAERITITGNTGIDALKWLVARFADEPALLAQAQAVLDATGVPALRADSAQALTLITGHRRESFGPGFVAICQAIAELAQRHPQRQFVYPVHPNPAVRDTVFRELGGELPNVHLIEPLDYLPFVRLMSRAELILTDSGGVQEEAPSLGKRVVVMRDCTERAEGVTAGLVRLTGADRGRIVAAAEDAYAGTWPEEAGGSDVYGDGRASERILAALAAWAGGSA